MVAKSMRICTARVLCVVVEKCNDTSGNGSDVSGIVGNRAT